MRAYLINLDRSPDRLARMQAEFDRVGAAFTRFTGVDTLGWANDKAEAYFRDHPAFSSERLPGDAGAFLSHFGVWQAIAARDEAAAAVFEDDVHLAFDLTALLSASNWIPADADLVRLESNGKMVLREGRPVGVAPRRKLYRTGSGTWGAAGYVITRKAAVRLIRTAADLHTHIDWFLFKPTRSPVAASLCCYQMLPAVCIQDGYLNGSKAAVRSIVSHGVRTVVAAPGRSWLSRLLPHRKRPVPYVP